MTQTTHSHISGVMSSGLIPGPADPAKQGAAKTCFSLALINLSNCSSCVFGREGSKSTGFFRIFNEILYFFSFDNFLRYFPILRVESALGCKAQVAGGGTSSRVTSSTAPHARVPPSGAQGCKSVFNIGGYDYPIKAIFRHWGG